jgi:cell division protein FtsB
LSKNIAGEMLVGRVDLGGSNCSASYLVEDAMARSIVRLECEAEELRAEVAMLQEQARILAEERDEARVMLEQKWAEQDPPLIRMMQERDEARMQYRTTEALGMALAKTIDELKAEKAAIFAQLVGLQAGSRRATLHEISESVREKYEPEHEGEGMENG